MNNRVITSLGLLSLAAVVAPSSAEAAKKSKKGGDATKPNILFIITDQHRADVFSFAGNPDVQTPNFDKMAANGVVFNRAYAMDAVSGPSRTCIFTGLYPRTTGQLDNGAVKTDATLNATSLQYTLQQRGYATYGFGKRHLHDAADKGWDVLKAHSKQENPADNYVKWIEEQGYAQEFGEDWASEFGKFPPGNSLEGTKYPSAKMGTRTSRLPEDYTMEAYSARNAMAVIEEHGSGSKKGEPFFLYTSFYRPHQPYNPLPKYLQHHDASQWGTGRNNGGAVAMPSNLHEPAENLTPFMKNLRANRNGIWCLGLASEDEQLYRDYITGYYALVEEVDHWVGELYAALEREGLLENTIIVYTSDHGDFVGNHGMIEKAAAGHNVYEDTLRVPLLFSWKGHIEPNRTKEDLVGLVDLYPTLIEMTGAKLLPDMKYKPEGISLAETLLKDSEVGRKYIVSENWSQASIITAESKLALWLDPSIMYNGGRDWRNTTNFLFEYATDPTEINNRYAAMKDSDEVKRMKEYYAEFEKEFPAIGKEEWIEKLKARKK